MNTSERTKDLSCQLGKQVRSQFSHFTCTDMSAFTVEKVKSDFKTAKTDLSVFSLEGKLVLLGAVTSATGSSSGNP